MKKSLLMLATILAIPAMLCSCGKKAADNTPADGGNTPAEPAEQDPNELLEGFEDAVVLTNGTPYTTAVPLEVGSMKKFKIQLAAGEGKDRLLYISTAGAAISAPNNVEIKWLDYKGDALVRKDAFMWGTYDGWMYMTAIKTADDGHESKLSRIEVTSLDKRIPVTTSNSEYATLNSMEVGAYKEAWFSFEITQANKNYAISFSGMGSTFASNGQYSVKDHSLTAVTVTDTYETMYKYNFTAESTGLFSVRVYNNSSTAFTLNTGAIIQIDKA